uniref:non-specific serine/threonine protein kinase n=1 Tax=Lygus hesperus TaxID=30085 RepID=A0A0A9Y1E0_LYGHE
MLQKYNAYEVVLFSDLTVKINHRNKCQNRLLMMTNLAIYNILPHNLKMRRRILITNLLAITLSHHTDDFVIHVAQEYDYRFRTSRRTEFITLLRGLYNQNTYGKRLPIKRFDVTKLKDIVLTKAMARLQTREDELRRNQLLTSTFDESDNEDEKQIKNQTTSLRNQPIMEDVEVSNREQKDDVITQIVDEKTTNKVRIEDFELLKVLGRGSFGKVIQVRHKITGKIYAMKIFKKKAVVAHNQMEHIRTERRILEMLQHPFLLTLRYSFQSKEKLYLVLDYFQGGELFFHLKNVRRFPEEVARIYVAEIALALGHLHKLGYIYRDLKPENILLDTAGHICLADFGLSKDISDEKAHTFCGTPEYLAPEIIAGKGHDKAVDWWSLGILLYELTVGIPPFYDPNINTMYVKILKGVLHFPPFFTEECKSIIVGLLNRCPEKRLGSFNDVEDIKNHPFYANFDFDKLLRKEYDVSFKPKIKNTEDTSNFDVTFTSEPPVDSFIPPSSLANELDNFVGFTYNPSDIQESLHSNHTKLQ